MIEETLEISITRSKKTRRPTFEKYYIIYSFDHECDFIIDEDLVSFIKPWKVDNSKKWINIIKEDLKLMDENSLWNLVEFSKVLKQFGCKLVFKKKHNSKENSKRYKCRLVAKIFTQKVGIDYKDTFLQFHIMAL